MTLCRAAWLALAAGIWAPAAETIPTELLPPDTQIVVSFSVHSLLDSPLLKGIPSDSTKLSTSFGAAMPLAGFDPLKDLDSIIWATSGRVDNSPGLAVLRGRFAGVKTEGARMYHGVPLLPDPKDPKATFAILDGETAIAGPTAELEAAIDRRGGAPVLKPALASRIAELNGHYDFWSVGRMPGGFPATSPEMKSLQAIDGFEFAATLQDGLRFHGEIHLRTERDAAQLESTIQQLSALMKANPSSGGSKFDLHVEHGRVELDLTVQEAELRKTLAAQKDSLASLLQSRISGQMSLHPPKSPEKIVTNERGETLSVTLPSGRN